MSHPALTSKDGGGTRRHHILTILGRHHFTSSLYSFADTIRRMNVTLLDFTAAGLVIALGSTLQASTGLGAGLIVVPLLALFHLEFVPGPVIFASLGLSLLMTLVGRNAIKWVHLHTSASASLLAC